MTVDEVVRMIKKILMETKIMKINDDKDISSAFTLFHVSPSKNGNDLSIDQYE